MLLWHHLHIKGGDTILSELIDQAVVLFSLLSGALQGLFIVFKGIIENPLLLFLLIFGIIGSCAKVKRH